MIGYVAGDSTSENGMWRGPDVGEIAPSVRQMAGVSSLWREATTVHMCNYFGFLLSKGRDIYLYEDFRIFLRVLNRPILIA